MKHDANVITIVCSQKCGLVLIYKGARILT